MKVPMFRVWSRDGFMDGGGKMLYSKDYPTHGELLTMAESDLLVLGPYSLSLMGFTGINDNYNQPIFEGDIVVNLSISGQPQEVKYLDLGGYYLVLNGRYKSMAKMGGDEIIVVGNIYEEQKPNTPWIRL